MIQSLATTKSLAWNSGYDTNGTSLVITNHFNRNLFGDPDGVVQVGRCEDDGDRVIGEFTLYTFDERPERSLALRLVGIELRLIQQLLGIETGRADSRHRVAGGELLSYRHPDGQLLVAEVVATDGVELVRHGEAGECIAGIAAMQSDRLVHRVLFARIGRNVDENRRMGVDSRIARDDDTVDVPFEHRLSRTDDRGGAAR
jgi:hypothetical protein